MRLEVALTPALLTDADRKVCVVIDVLRATSSLVTMFSRGLREALIAESIPAARRLAASNPRYLLCGERGGLPPPSFDYGNSPVEFAALDLRGRRAVMATTNGTRALARAAGSPVVLIGALLNARAAAAAALHEARRGDRDIALVCAGDGRGRRFSLEDTLCAGAIAEDLQSLAGAALRPDDSAIAAVRLHRSYRGSAATAFRESDHGASLVVLGLGSDVEFCARRDRFDLVPRLRRDARETLRVVVK